MPRRKKTVEEKDADFFHNLALNDQKVMHMERAILIGL